MNYQSTDNNGGVTCYDGKTPYLNKYVVANKSHDKFKIGLGIVKKCKLFILCTRVSVKNLISEKKH